jgi:hypothetical protein
MSGPPATFLLIDDGRLPALAAAVSQGESARARLWHLEEQGPSARRLRLCVERHAELFDAQAPLICPAWPGEAESSGSGNALIDASLLIRAAMMAANCGCRRILWPVQVGPDPDRVGRVVEIVASVTEIAELDACKEFGSISIDVPLVDLSDRQVVDLADDCGAPLEAFWPCESGGETPCGSCQGCRRWWSAFGKARVPWPWAAIPAA